MDAWYQDAIHDPGWRTHEPAAEVGALLVHGFTGSPFDMVGIADTFHAQGIDLSVMRLPGMARDILQLNDMTAAIWKDAVREAWAEVRERYKRVVLCGYSLGGGLSILAAVEHAPELLVLVAPLSRMPSRMVDLLPIGRFFVRGVNIYAGTDWTNDAIHDWYARVRPGLDTRNPDVQRLLSEEASFSTDMLNEMRGLCVEIRRQARALAGPTLIVQGDRDNVVYRQHTRELVRNIGGRVTYREVPGDHYIPLVNSPELPDLQALLADELRRAGVAASR